MPYSSPYSGSTPYSQGYQGQQGATQTPKPQVQAQQYRAPQWSPAPASTGQNLPQRNAEIPSGAPQGQRNASTPLQGNPASPVNPNGSINMGAGQQPTAAPTAQPIRVDHRTYAPPGGEDPAAFGAKLTNGMPVAEKPGWTWQHDGQGWTWAPAGNAQPGAAPGPVAQPNPALYSPYGAYPGRPEGTVYQPGQVPQYNFQDYQTAQFNQQAPAPYQAGTLDQFNAPNLGAYDQAQWAAIQNVLNNPGLGDTSLLKEQQKEGALRMQQDAQMQAQNRAAAFGRSSLSGQDAATQRRIGDATQQNILGSYRDIDIANAAQRNSDLLNAAGAAGQFTNQQADRANNFYRTGLAGQLSQESLYQNAVDSALNATRFNAEQEQRQADENFRGFSSQFIGPGFNVDNFLKQQQLNQAGVGSGLDAYNTDLAAFNAFRDDLARNKQIDLQSSLGNRGLDIDQQRLAQQGTQFDKSLQLDWAGLLNNMYLGRAGLGLNYAQLEQNGQNSMNNIIAQILGS